ncbi:MAG: GNAT family N-acetyltransferase [Spirochaetaceae bacterium]|jgi:predicted GNAT family acetyltransferase|nr:GNAT family N-acetyltransferase [Spirochaetaceae bacterium]
MAVSNTKRSNQADPHPESSWREFQDSEKYLLESFFKKNERFCVTACDRFRHFNHRYDQAWFTGEGAESPADALILYSKQTLFPVFNGQKEAHLPTALLHALKNIKIHALHGSAADTETLEKILLAPGIQAAEHNSYHLMELDSLDSEESAIGIPGLIIRKFDPADSEKILPLQEAYEKEEVLPEGTIFDPRLCRQNLAQIIKNHCLIVACLNGELIGKINTNAQSYSRYQLGGAYVSPRYRRLGIGSALVSAIARLILSQGKGLTLFVKKQNTAAISIYQKTGFKNIGDFGIVYMNQRI